MKSLVPNTTLNIIVKSSSYTLEDVDEGEICKMKWRPEKIIIFQDVYSQYGYEKTLCIEVDANDIDKITEHLKKIREIEFKDEYEDDLPF